MDARIARVETDLVNHAKTLTEHNTWMNRKDRDDAVRANEDKHLDERLERIEAQLATIISVGKWALITVGSAVILAVVTFVLRGGLVV
jgi:hypothetical protein